jgi:ABC-type lipoprotein export system ATPase subunit
MSATAVPAEIVPEQIDVPAPDADKKLTMLRRKKIGFVFQFFNLLPMPSAEENVVLPLSMPAASRVTSGWWTATRAARRPPSSARAVRIDRAG